MASVSALWLVGSWQFFEELSADPRITRLELIVQGSLPRNMPLLGTWDRLLSIPIVRTMVEYCEF